MHALRVTLAAAVLTIAGLGAARPDSRDDVSPGFGASLRLGYALPAGGTGVVPGLNGRSSTDLGTLWSGSLPVQVDVGYRFSPHWSAAVFAQYAVGFVAAFVTPDISASCASSGERCSGHVVRAGVEGFHHFLPGDAVDPWVGLGVGYEWDTLTVAGGAASDDLKFRGFELLNVQLGVDWRLAPGFALGPFLQTALGAFSSVEQPGGPPGSFGAGVAFSQDITDRRLHAWLQLGVRGTYSL